MKIKSGQIYEAPWPLCWIMMVQFVTTHKKTHEALFLLLTEPKISDYWGKVSMIPTKKNGQFLYTEHELEEKLSKWKLRKDLEVCFRNRNIRRRLNEKR